MQVHILRMMIVNRILPVLPVLHLKTNIYPPHAAWNCFENKNRQVLILSFKISWEIDRLQDNYESRQLIRRE